MAPRRPRAFRDPTSRWDWGHFLLVDNHTVDGCEIRSHHFETLVETIVCWHLIGGIASFQGVVGGAKWSSQASTVGSYGARGIGRAAQEVQRGLPADRVFRTDGGLAEAFRKEAGRALTWVFWVPCFLLPKAIRFNLAL